MLILLRFASVILALLLLLSIIISFAVVAKNYIEGRFFGGGKQKKSKIGDLPSDAGVRDLILANQTDEAIDLYQRFTGVDEFTARQVIEDIEREVRLSSFDTDLNTILSTQGKASAIEAYQAGTGADLAEALAYVENLEKA